MLHNLLTKLPFDELAQKMLDEHWIDLYQIDLKYINVALMKAELIALFTQLDIELRNAFSDENHNLEKLFESEVFYDYSRKISDILFLPACPVTLDWLDDINNDNSGAAQANYYVDSSAATSSFINGLNLDATVPGGNIPLLSELKWQTYDWHVQPAEQKPAEHEQHTHRDWNVVCYTPVNRAILGDISIEEKELEKLPISFNTLVDSSSVTFIYTNHLDMPEAITYNVADIQNVAAVLRTISSFYNRNIRHLLNSEQKKMRESYSGKLVNSLDYVNMCCIGRYMTFKGLSMVSPSVYSVNVIPYN
jgi:hypothetical protein